ncbi:MAG: hypothetical protein OFPII_36450 [Osedax symbiont Rs1]|nr:MAG: hypothetical protein OFPII_36450 [Osedax symbiont Rs1]
MHLETLATKVEHIKNISLKFEFRHAVMAFSVSTLCQAVALILIPDGIAN